MTQGGIAGVSLAQRRARGDEQRPEERDGSENRRDTDGETPEPVETDRALAVRCGHGSSDAPAARRAL